METVIVCFLLLFYVFHISGVTAIDCFKCVSLDGQNPHCEDPFHHNFSSAILHSPCWAGRKNRDGVFPATACVKLNGIFVDSGKSMFVRDCALDSGSLTTDTELVRMSHCGAFYFEGQYVKGCVQSCFEDACNHTASLFVVKLSYLLGLTLILPLIINLLTLPGSEFC